MPFGDRTGPAGSGPRSGRGAGLCGGFGVPGFMNRGSGFGPFGGGRGGGGRGRRNRFYASGLTGWQRAFDGPYGSPGPSGQYPGVTGGDLELGALKQQAGYFQSALEKIRKRIEALESKPKSD